MLSLQTNTYQLEEMEQVGSERYYLLTVNGRPYKIGELIYLIVDGLSRQLSYQEIGSLLNARVSDNRFSASDVAEVVQKNLKPMGLFDAPVSVAPNREALGSVFLRRKLLSFRQYEWVLRLTQYAFSPALFVSVFALALVANVYLMRELLALDHYVADYNARLITQGECGQGYTYLLFFYPAVLLILLSHEFGHAAASYRFGVKPKEIGIGLYLIFPVLYTDVTDIWRLSKWKRVIVNLGGLYVQLLINLLLIGFLVANFGDYDRITISRYLIQLNVAMLIINTLPFIKLDGYWIYSDLFSLPNLHRQASICLRWATSLLVPRLIRRPEQSSVNPKNPYLIAYTIGRYAFLAYFVIWALQFLVNQLGGYPSLVRAMTTDCTLCTIEPWLKATATLLVFGFSANRYLKPGYGWVRRTWFPKA